MSRFDFITDPEFRASLEGDYEEMRHCHEARAWKSVQVIAGSIVEALLIDYLAARSVPLSGKKDPLKLDLAEAIAICETEKVITDRSANLCSVIRSYRNLIHPGRLIRLKEPSPSPQSAGIAVALVDLIIDEIAKVRKGDFGFTAEQILAKLEKDHNSIALLPHLLKEVHETELGRLLCVVLPARYEELKADEDPWNGLEEINRRLARGFRVAFDSAAELLKVKVASRFPQILKKEEGYRVDLYAAAFFRATDLKFVQERDRPIVKEFLLSRLPTQHDRATIEQLTDLAGFLSTSELPKWLDPYIRTLISSKASEGEKEAVHKALQEAQWPISQAGEKAIDKRLDEWISHLRNRDQFEQAEMIALLKSELASERLPF